MRILVGVNTEAKKFERERERGENSVYFVVTRRRKREGKREWGKGVWRKRGSKREIDGRFIIFLKRETASGRKGGRL